ncbi:MAG: ABC transporter permease [Chryseobacterium sp.]|jgi:ABC-2 type transport system permease protein|uniref:ABC transporter permease n=1 Tax=Chryseobacterium sp. TaxID=1871047 RepID=UPI002831A7A3|nr:ABC transporter permease [Chryseobacterium sp.]MDR2236862.1 ABC transporter permease [Chryseobacterium sp.]
MNTMKNGFWKVFFTEWKTIIKKPSIILWTLGVPVVIFILYASIFGDGVLRKLPLAVLDEDKTSVSRELKRQISANSSLNFTHEVQNEEEGLKLIRTSKVIGLVIIPNDFQKDISKGKIVQVVLYVNNHYMTPAGIVSKGFNAAVGGFAASAKVNVLMKKGSSPLQAKEMIQPVVMRSHTLFNPFLNYAYYLCLSFFPMVLQLTVMITTLYILGSVLKYNQGRQLYNLSGDNVIAAYFGKILPYTFIFSILAFLMTAYLFGYLAIPLNTPVVNVYLLNLILIVVYQLIAIFFVTTSKDFRSLCATGGGYSSLAFSFSGYTFPQEGMPTAIKILDSIFPFSSYARMLINTAIKGMPLVESLPYIIGFAVFALIGLLSLKKFSYQLQKGHYEE